MASPFSPEQLADMMANIHENDGYQLIIPVVVFGVIAFVCVVLRPIARRSSRIVLGLDDWLAIASMFFAIGLVVTGVLVAKYGVGKHIIAVSPDDLTKFGKANFALQICYVPCLSLAKLSILALYHRIFRVSGRLFNYAIYATAIYIILWFIGVYLAIFLGCNPIHTYWTAACAPKYKESVSTGVLNIISDIVVILLPQAQVWGLQMPIRKKLGLSIVFLMGMIATAFSIARIPILKAGNQGGNPDLTFHLVLTYVFTIMEPLLAIICSCLPVLQGLFIKGVNHGFGMSSLRSLLRSTRGNTTQGSSKQGWSAMDQSGHNASMRNGSMHKTVSENSLPATRDEEMGYHEMNPVKPKELPSRVH